jgi:DNA-binding NarL/FixJ family response regulator
MEKIKVFLSDAQVLFREGIHFILSGEEEFEVTGETTGNEEAMVFIEANPPNVAVLSMYDKILSGPEVTRRAKRSQPSISVILTIQQREEERIFEAIKSGASAYIDRDTEPEQLLECIRTVSQGGLPILNDLMSPGLASMALVEFEALNSLNKHMDNLLARVTQKEMQVLNGFAGGSTKEDVAVKAGTNTDGVLRHLRQIYNKLVTNDAAEAVIEATQQSLPPAMRTPLRKDTKPGEYITRTEFNEFKDSLLERLKSLLGELS